MESNIAHIENRDILSPQIALFSQTQISRNSLESLTFLSLDLANERWYMKNLILISEV